MSLVILLSTDLDHRSIKFLAVANINSHLFFGVFVSEQKVVDLIVELSCMVIIGVNGELNVIVVNIFF